MQELIDLISKHVPDLRVEDVLCTCGATLPTSDDWAKHLAKEIATIEGFGAFSANA